MLARSFPSVLDYSTSTSAVEIFKLPRFSGDTLTMLSRKRGAIRDKSRKMAKKAAPAALQTEVNTDEEFEKILERPGLVLVDVYSEWSGPCTGMVSVLKKVKMETGGDNLSYAVAKCDNITSLARFRGKSEPTWMFLRDGMMVNLIFGADCPELLNVLTKELKRLQTGGAPEYSIPVTEMSPLEAKRIQEMEELIKAREAEKLAKIEAENKRKFEAELAHLLEALPTESIVIMFPWIFTDDEGKKREKRSSSAYLELTDQLLTGIFRVEQEIWKELDEGILEELLKESGWEDFSDYTKHLLLNGRSLCLRLKVMTFENDIDTTLMNVIYGEPQIPESSDDLVEGCFAQRYLPPIRGSFKDEESVVSDSDKLLSLLTVWIPFNSRNRVWAIRNIFAPYVEKHFPFEDTEAVIPVTLFKYDSTRKKELQVVLEMYQNDVVEFGVFERDKLPDPKKIASSIREFDFKFKEKSSYEVFVAVVKKSTPESFLSFAGIGPYHVSENEEKAIEEMEQYFPPSAEVAEEVVSDYGDKSDDEREEEEEEEEEEDEEEEAVNADEDLANIMFL